MDGSASANKTWKRARVAAIAILGVFAIGLLLDYGTSSPRLCASCHEIQPRADSWAESAHGGVKCVECHQPPTAWYAVPQRLVDRGRLFGHDIAVHLSGDYPDPVDAPISQARAITDDVCLQCHDPNRKATSGYRILIDHVEHAKRNGSCVSCHVRTAHPIEERGTALSLMAQCFTCHGTEQKPEASAECSVCHPADYEPRPASHSESSWQQAHGKAALPDIAQCMMCHEGTYCEDCHGLPMPHPESWAKGHGGLAKLDRAACGKCHGSQPDMCAMCHHTDYEPGKGTWAKQHYLDVEKRGAARCMECHSPVYCIGCHAAGEGGESEEESGDD